MLLPAAGPRASRWPEQLVPAPAGQAAAHIDLSPGRRRWPGEREHQPQKHTAKKIRMTSMVRMPCRLPLVVFTCHAARSDLGQEVPADDAAHTTDCFLHRVGTGTQCWHLPYCKNENVQDKREPNLACVYPIHPMLFLWYERAVTLYMP